MEPPRRIDYLPLDELRRAPRNAKAHRDDLIGASIGRWGVIEPQVVDERTGSLISGHGRLDDLQKRREEGVAAPDGVQVDESGAWLVPVVRGWASTSDLDADAAAVALNRIGEAGGWDERLLADVLTELSAWEMPEVTDFDPLAGVGYSAQDLDELLVSVAAHERHLPEGADPDEVPPEPVEPVTRPGDLWVMGEHRVLCADSAAPSNAAHVMGGADQADAIWTDPPYGVSYVGKTAEALTIANDDGHDLRGFLAGVLAAIAPSVRPGSPFYLAAPPGPRGTEFRLAIADAGWSLHQELVWVKNVFVLGHSDYHYRHEPVLYGWLPGPGRSGRGNHNGSRWRGDHAADSVFEVERPTRSVEHPTMKPVALVVPMLANSTLPGEIVLDPFGGSGTTLIAAHGLGRRARLIELSPAYCDVILTRFERLTGIIPVLESTGDPHSFVAEDD